MHRSGRWEGGREELIFGCGEGVGVLFITLKLNRLYYHHY